MPKAAADKTDKVEKKTKSTAKSSTTGTKKKSSPYNVFMKNELAKLKEQNPDMPHKERFKTAASSWADSKENPKNQK